MDNTIQTIKIEELEKRLNALNKNIKNDETNLILLSDHISNLAEVISLLRMNVDALFKLSPYFFNYGDIFNFKYKRWGVGSVRPDRIFFVCTPGVKTYIKVTADVFYNLNTSLEPYFRAILNSTSLTEGIIYEENFSNNTNFTKTITFTYSFVPETADNTLMFVAHSGTGDYLQGTSGYNNLKVEIIGYNVAFISRKYDFRLFITKDNYYLTKNLYDKSEFLKVPINQVDLSAPFNLVDNVRPTDIEVYKNRLHHFNVTYVPNIIKNETETALLIDDSTNRFYFSYSYNSLVLYAKQNPAPNEYSQMVPLNRGITYTVGPPVYVVTTPYNVGAVSSNYECSLSTMVSIPNNTSEKEMLLNNESIPGLWVDNCSVFIKDWEDHVGEGKNCYVATNSLAEIYFFDSDMPTYKIYIGKGHQVSAFMQSNSSINIYYKWLNDIHKKILVYNLETEKYELQDGEEIIENAWEFLEGYGNDYFINKQGTWEYVPN